MEEKEKDVFLEEIKKGLQDYKAGETPKHSMRRTKRIGKLSPMAIGLITIAIAGAMLTGLLFTVFHVNMTGTVVLTGTQHPLFQFDHNEFETPYLNLTGDISALGSGETKTFSHYIINKDAGAWVITYNLTAEQYFYNDPPSPWYGLNVSIGNTRLNGVPVTAFVLSPGDNFSFDIVWSLHHEFVTPEVGPFPSNIGITLSRFVDTIHAVDDTQLIAGSETDISVLLNDVVGQGVHIISVTQTTYPNQVVTINPDGQSIHFETFQQGWTTATFTYTIAADLSPEVQSTATVTVHL